MIQRRRLLVASLVLTVLVLTPLLLVQLIFAGSDDADAVVGIEIESATVLPDGITEIPIYAGSVPAPGLGAYTLRVDFDPSVMTVLDVLEGNPTFGLPAVFTINPDNVQITDFRTADPGLEGDFDVIILRVQGASVAGSTPLDLTVTSFKDPDSVDIPHVDADGTFTVTPTSVVVGSATISFPDTEVDIPITAFGLPSPGLGAFTLVVSFDPVVELGPDEIQVVEVIDAFPGDPPFGGFFTKNIAGGLVAISDLHTGQTGPEGEHVLAILRLRTTGPPGTQTLPIRIDALKDADNINIPAVGVAGQVEAVTECPCAVIQGPDSADEGEQVQFDGSGSVGGITTAQLPITQWDWDFGDGITGAGQTVDYTYDDNGNFTVTLVVTDSAGDTGGATHDIQINDVAPDIDPVADKTANEGGIVNLNASFSDP